MLYSSSSSFSYLELKHSVTIYVQITKKNKIKGKNDTMQFGNYEMVKLSAHHHYKNETHLMPIPFFVCEENATKSYGLIKKQLHITSKHVAPDTYPNMNKLSSVARNGSLAQYSMEGIPRIY